MHLTQAFSMFQIINELLFNRETGCHKCDLTTSKKYFKRSKLAKSQSTLEIFEIIRRYFQKNFPKKIVVDSTKVRKGADKSSSRVVSLYLIKRQAVNNLSRTSGEPFQAQWRNKCVQNYTISSSEKVRPVTRPTLAKKNYFC